MRIAQLLLDDASAYERKSQQIDFAALSQSHQVTTCRRGDSIDADVVHVYGPPEIPAESIQTIGTIPFIANGAIVQRRFSFRKARQPRQIITPLLEPQQPPATRDVPPATYVPEAVDDIYFADSPPHGELLLGTYARADVHNAVEQAMARIDRFRDDVTWRLFDNPPTVEDILSVTVWVDPAISAMDYSGYVAEALSAGVTVVASATPLNEQRLEKGRSGFLVPPNDPNEMTHAILAALFKPEAARAKREAARQTAIRFRVRHRVRALEKIYDSIAR